MRQGGLPLGRILGIPISADLGVLLIGGLLTWSFATVVLPDGAPGRPTLAYWSLGIVGAVLFLGSLLAHELSHSVVARRNGIEVEGVTLWMLGGVSQLKDEARTAGAEFRIAAAGPATSLLLGVLFVGAGIGLRELGVPNLYPVMLVWLGLINGFLAVFNLLPGAPLDGGRILGAAIWRIRGDRTKAKITAARVGRVVGIGLIALGAVELIGLRSGGGLWTVLIGWFLMNAARSEEAHYVGQQALGGLTVAQVMAPAPASTHTWSTVADLVEGPLRTTSQSAVPVLGFDGSLAGVVTMDLVRRVPAESWRTLDVAHVMIPASRVATVAPDEPLLEALERVGPLAGGLLVVVDRGRVVGLVGRQEVQRAVQLGRLAGRPTGGAAGGATPHPGAAMTPPPPPDVPRQQWDGPQQGAPGQPHQPTHTTRMTSEEVR